MSRVIINNTNAGSVFTDPVTISDMQNQHIKNITIKSRKHPDQLTLLQIINSNQLHIDTVIIEGILDDSSRIHWAETVANGIQILSENVKIGKVVLKNIHCGIQIRAEGCCVDSIIASNVSGDLWQITASNCEIKSYSVFNMLKVFAHDLSESGKNGNPKGIYHSDIGMIFSQDGKGLISNVTIRNGKLDRGWHRWEHPSPQGILCVDGNFSGIEITNQNINGVNESHGITIVNGKNCVIDKIETNGLVRAEGDSNIITNITKKPENDVMYRSNNNEIKKTPYSIAVEQMGVSEIPGHDHEKRIVEYFTATTYHASDDETPWCSAVHCWIHKQSSVPHTRSAAALSWLDWGVECKKKIGCTIVLDRGKGRGHVGFYLGEDDANYFILGGNQSNTYKVQSFSKNEGKGWYFRKQKRGWNSKSAWTDLLRATGVMGAGGYSVNEIIDSPEKPSSKTKQFQAYKTSSKTAVAKQYVPEGYKMVPIDLWYIVLFSCVAMLCLSIFTFIERIKKIKRFGI